jgi:hypothetical protein
MTTLPPCGYRLDMRKVLLVLGLLSCFSSGAAASDLITGTVRNQTRGQVAPGEDVVLMRLDQGMQEEARTKTDAQGAFALKVHDSDKSYLVRVVHQNVNYDQRASAGRALSIQVFDAAQKVQGVTGGIEIIRTGTTGRLLHVSDMIEIKNESSPPLTQAGERTFDVYLPPTATIDSVLAAGEGKIGVLVAATPVSGEPGHYTVNFPLRPGSTKFAFNYDISYDGHAAFRPRLAYPMQQLAVMIPPTMRFSPQSPAFQLLDTGNKDYQVQAASQVKAGVGPAFEITGAGTMPPLRARTQSPAGTQAAAVPGSADQSAAVSSAINPRAQTPARSDADEHTSTPVAEPSTFDEWLLAAAAALVLGSCGFLIWRSRYREAIAARGASAETRGPSPSRASTLETLKEELFQLETKKLRGAISREEYDTAKRVIEETVHRAVGRGSNWGIASQGRSRSRT